MKTSLANCSDSQPFYNAITFECMSCSLPESYFDFDSNKCLKCEINNIFNVKAKRCEVKIIKMNANLATGVDNYCCEKPTLDSNLQSCP